MDIVHYCDCPRYCKMPRKQLHVKTWRLHEKHRAGDSVYNTPFVKLPNGDERPHVSRRRRARRAERAQPSREATVEDGDEPAVHNDARAPPEHDPAPPADDLMDVDEQDFYQRANDIRSSSPPAPLPANDNYATPRASPSPAPSLPPDLLDDDEAVHDETAALILSWIDNLSAIDVVAIAQEFILHLQEATLDDCGLSDDQLAALLNPPQTPTALQDGPAGADRDLMLSLRLFLSHTTSSEENYEASRSAVLRAFPQCNLLHYDAVQKRLEELTGVYTIEDDICVDSCIAFTGQYSDLDGCPICGEARYHPGTRKPRQRMSTFPIGPQIQAMHRHAETGELMDYWDQQTSAILSQLEAGVPISVFDDVTCGSDVLKALDAHELGPDHTVLILSMDGVQLYRNKKSGLWIWVFIVINISPCKRFKKKYVLPGGSFPGPNKPQITESILFRTLQHISALNRQGGLPIWDAYRATQAYVDACATQNRIPRDSDYLSPLYILLGTADAEAMPLWTGGVKHSGRIGCRIACGLPGRRMSNGRRGGHYYPMLAKPDNYTVQGCDHDDQPYDSARSPDRALYLDNLQRICDVETQAAYKRTRLATGICKPSPLLGLYVSQETPCILGLPNMCPGDNMHLLTNIASLFIELWRGETDCLASDSVHDWDWATLADDAAWKQHGAEVADCTRYLPTSFERPPRNPAEKINSGYKATEYLNYFYVLGPALFYIRLRLAYWSNYCKLVVGVRIVYQKRVRAEQLLVAHGLLSEFLEEFEVLYIRRREDRMHFHTQVIHFVQHLVPEVVRLGPGAMYAQWTMERTIGNLTDELRQHSNPYRNLAARSLRRGQVNALKAICPDMDERCDQDDALPDTACNIGNGYALLRARQRYATPVTHAEHAAIAVYMEEQLRCVPIDEDRDRVPRVQRWAGLRLPNGQSARSTWSHDKNTSASKRDTCNVKVDLGDGPDDVAFARVRYYFQVPRPDGTMASVVLVEMLGDVKDEHYADSHGAVIAARLLGDRDVRVLDHSAILSVVTVQPYPESWGVDWDGYYFVAEKMGLDIAWFDMEEDDDAPADDPE